MRSLGDTYIKDEFRRHKAITNPIQIVGFLGGWKIYLDQLTGKKEGDEGVQGAAAGSVVGAQGEKVRFEGRRLAPEEFDKVSWLEQGLIGAVEPAFSGIVVLEFELTHVSSHHLPALRGTALPAT